MVSIKKNGKNLVNYCTIKLAPILRIPIIPKATPPTQSACHVTITHPVSSPNKDEANNGGVALAHKVALDMGWVAGLHLQCGQHEINALEEVNNLSSWVRYEGPMEGLIKNGKG